MRPSCAGRLRRASTESEERRRLGSFGPVSRTRRGANDPNVVFWEAEEQAVRLGGSGVSEGNGGWLRQCWAFRGEERISRSRLRPERGAPRGYGAPRRRRGRREEGTYHGGTETSAFVPSAQRLGTTAGQAEKNRDGGSVSFATPKTGSHN